MALKSQKAANVVHLVLYLHRISRMYFYICNAPRVILTEHECARLLAGQSLQRRGASASGATAGKGDQSTATKTLRSRSIELYWLHLVLCLTHYRFRVSLA